MKKLNSIEEFPKLDPLTNREICENCWNGNHYRRVNKNYKATTGHDSGISNCNGICNCVHLSEEKYATEERRKMRDSRYARKKLMQEYLAQSPLRCL